METFQQYVNEQFIGKDPNRTDVGRDIFKALKENWIEKIGYIPTKPMAIIKVTEKDSPIIKSLGFSEPDDLLLDNFGVMMSSCINTGADVQRNVVDYTGVVRTMHFQENGNINMAFATYQRPPPFFPGVDLSLGGYLRVGSGVTPPARSDFQIETPMIIPPMTGFLNVGIPYWIEANQEAVVQTLITPALIAGDINECGLYSLMRLGSSNSSVIIMMSHDAATASFNEGDHIEMSYTWSLS